MNKKWSEEAPSNIALVKYMGKKSVEENLPDNPSLSLTLPHLLTAVEVELVDLPEDTWEPLDKEGFFRPSLGPKEAVRFLKHFEMLKKDFEVEQNFIIRSANNFPQNCGLASSASSFAALTKASIKAFTELKGMSMPDSQYMSSLSRMGSGSSCRSFHGPWCLWSENTVSEVELPYKDLLHMVVVSSGEKKRVSSSEAHKKVSSSMLYQGREERARIRLGLLMESMTNKNWKEAFEICWAEFWDMHALFETSHPSFGYMNEGSLKVLSEARSIWKRISDGPLVTMDAGPNVHMLFRKEQISMARSLKEKFVEKDFKVYTNKI